MPKVSQASRTFHHYHLHHLHPTKRNQNIATCLLMTIIVLTFSTCLCATMWSAASNLWELHFKQSPVDTAYNVVGKPSISANFINQVLTYYHSPAQGKGQSLYNDGVTYNIDPIYALAFFMHESSFGTQGMATITHSLGNIRASAGYAQYSGYRFYHSWDEGFVDWYKLIAQQYVEQWNLHTVDQIIPIYAPASDANDEGLYIRSIKYAVGQWRNGKIEVDL